MAEKIGPKSPQPAPMRQRSAGPRRRSSRLRTAQAVRLSSASVRKLLFRPPYPIAWPSTACIYINGRLGHGAKQGELRRRQGIVLPDRAQIITLTAEKAAAWMPFWPIMPMAKVSGVRGITISARVSSAPPAPIVSRPARAKRRGSAAAPVRRQTRPPRRRRCRRPRRPAPPRRRNRCPDRKGYC